MAIPADPGGEGGAGGVEWESGVEKKDIPLFVDLSEQFRELGFG